MDLSKFQQHINQGAGDKRALPPVDKWNPDFCGDIDMRIALDGRWWYTGTPIGRHALVKLFAGVLKKEEDNYYLVTPVEKVGIQVEDVPFVIINWRYDGDTLVLTTQTEDDITVGEDHPVELRQPPEPLRDEEGSLVPYVNVRRNLWARLHQNVYYQLIEQAEQVTRDSGDLALTLRSGNYTFTLGVLPAGLA